LGRNSQKLSDVRGLRVRRLFVVIMNDNYFFSSCKYTMQYYDYDNILGAKPPVNPARSAAAKARYEGSALQRRNLARKAVAEEEAASGVERPKLPRAPPRKIALKKWQSEYIPDDLGWAADNMPLNIRSDAARKAVKQLAKAEYDCYYYGQCDDAPVYPSSYVQSIPQREKKLKKPVRKSKISAFARSVIESAKAMQIAPSSLAKARLLSDLGNIAETAVSEFGPVEAKDVVSSATSIAKRDLFTPAEIAELLSRISDVTERDIMFKRMTEGMSTKQKKSVKRRAGKSRLSRREVEALEEEEALKRGVISGPELEYLFT
jgi:hypothetical protein